MSSDQRHGTVSVHVAYVMLVTVMMLWASGVIVAKSVAELVPPIGFSFWRWLCAVSLLTPLAARQALLHWSYIRTRAVQFLLLGLFFDCLF